ncbi:unnamed protein product [Linum tenue]|uniref:Uncharacterized protein n=1 Tax=Linum tenue TaxID=586396 RepID=A0AAV0I897_9ROSI|nr:unnamed protein product [Linum tenue]CAI0461354.1 unnamed protein product [Linum tenue]
MAQSPFLQRARAAAASYGGVMAAFLRHSLRTLAGVRSLARSWLVLCMGWISPGNREPGR